MSEDKRFTTDELLEEAQKYIKAKALNVAAHPEVSYLTLRKLEHIDEKLDQAVEAFNRLAAAIERQNALTEQQQKPAKPTSLKPLEK